MLIRVPNLLTCLLEVSKYHKWIKTDYPTYAYSLVSGLEAKVLFLADKRNQIYR